MTAGSHPTAAAFLHGQAIGVLVVGEALVDVVSRADGSVDEAPGGSPANVALTLGRLGRAPRLLTSLADDAHGRAVRAWLEESGVGVTAVPADRTATATARLDDGGSATYEFDLRWSLPVVPPLRAGIVHIGSVAALLDPGAAAVRDIVSRLRSSALVTYDPNTRPALLGDPSAVRGQVEDLVNLSDIVKASDEDLLWLYPDREPLDIAREWLGRGPGVVVVTGGSDGARAVVRAGVVSVPAERVAVVDTVGAGDTFMGALIDSLVRGGYIDARARGRVREIGLDALRDMIRFCARAAAVTVSRPGADPPTRAELDAPVDPSVESADGHALVRGAE